MNILIQYLDNKFTNNIAEIKLDNTNIYTANINNNLYAIHYSKNISHLFVSASLITNEIQQYIAEFFQSVKIFIYHDTGLNHEILDTYKNTCIHLIDKKYKTKNTISIPVLVNTSLYNGIKNNIEKTHDIVCFLDNLKEIPDKLKLFLYPNSQLRIILFNNANIKHSQNLGTLTEYDKSIILSQAKYFIPIDENYIAEAFISGCEVIDIEELASLNPKKYLQKPEYITYQVFMQSLLSNK
jgi:hypothetical protein